MTTSLLINQKTRLSFDIYKAVIFYFVFDIDTYNALQSCSYILLCDGKVLWDNVPVHAMVTIVGICHLLSNNFKHWCLRIDAYMYKILTDGIHIVVANCRGNELFLWKRNAVAQCFTQALFGNWNLVGMTRQIVDMKCQLNVEKSTMNILKYLWKLPVISLVPAHVIEDNLTQMCAALDLLTLVTLSNTVWSLSISNNPSNCSFAIRVIIPQETIQQHLPTKKSLMTAFPKNTIVFMQKKGRKRPKQENNHICIPPYKVLAN